MTARQASLRAIRVLAAFAAAWLALAGVGRIFLLRTNWPLWPAALTAVLVAEVLVWLYGLERRVVSRRAGLALVGLRLTLLSLVILMLVQPVLAWSWSQARKRALAILVDTSASMLIADKQMPPHEKLRLAEAFSTPAAERAVRLEEHAQALAAARESLLPEVAWLDRLVQGKRETAQGQLLQRRKALAQAVEAHEKDLVRRVEAVDALLKDSPELGQPLRTSLLDAKAALNGLVRPRLADAAVCLADKHKDQLADNLPRLRDDLERAASELAKTAPVLERVQIELDALQYARLGDADKAAVDAIAALPRLDLAKSVLLHRPVPPGLPRRRPGEPGKSLSWISSKKDSAAPLLEKLRQAYDVKVYTFASELAPTDLSGWSDATVFLKKAAEAAGHARLSEQARSTAASEPATRPDPGAGDKSVQRTDLAGAVRKALSEIGSDNLAGVLVLSDGQDNGRENPEPLARQMGGRSAAFCTVLLGSEKPPTDAAIISLEAPDAVFLADRMYVNAELKLDGLAGKDVKIALYDGQETVDSETIHVPGDVYRARLGLADEPKKPGAHAYRFRIDPCAGEVFGDNNAYALAISVTDEKTKLLLIDSRPRWEFRYLKNLFSGRDKTVRLQHLLLEPDSFAGQPAPTPVAASVTRPEGQEEATTMPATEQDWLKFDVIILGDVPAKALGDERMKVLKKFVADRGGALVFIAGPSYMPGDYAATPLAEMIPLKLTDTAERGTVGPEDRGTARPWDRQTETRALPSSSAPRYPVPRADGLPVPWSSGFRIGLTPAGRDHVIFRQDVSPEKSQQVWESIPPIFWRSPYESATPACTVLAYAVEADAPRWLLAGGEGPAPATGPEALAKMRQEYQRQHALAAVAWHGLGKVMMLTFDQTWRLRYRVGDTYHHKFWGQVIRWATAGKLPAGGSLVKLGSEKTRYGPHEKPVVRAKMVKEDFSPLVTDQAAIKIFSGDKLVGRVPLRYQADSPGLYQGALEELPPGTYRLELDCPAAVFQEKLLSRDGVKAVSVEISVDPAAPTEQIELAGNRNLAARLAGLSHQGAVVPAWQAGGILAALPSGRWEKRHSFQFELWDSWLLLALFCLVAAAEWILRKRVGLA